MLKWKRVQFFMIHRVYSIHELSTPVYYCATAELLVYKTHARITHALLTLLKPVLRSHQRYVRQQVLDLEVFHRDWQLNDNVSWQSLKASVGAGAVCIGPDWSMCTPVLHDVTMTATSAASPACIVIMQSSPSGPQYALHTVRLSVRAYRLLDK